MMKRDRAHPAQVQPTYRNRIAAAVLLIALFACVFAWNLQGESINPHPPSAAVLDRQHLQNLVQWVQDNDGSVVGGLESALAPLPPANLWERLFGGSANLRHVISSQHIDRDQEIMWLPSKLVMRRLSLGLPEIVTGEHWGLTDVEVLGFFLMMERRKAEASVPSFWRSYVEALPETIDNAHFWSDERLSKSTWYLQEMVRHTEKQFKISFEFVMKMVSENPELQVAGGAYQLPEYIWGLSMVRSRGFQEPEICAKCHALYPLMDMLNHDPEAVNVEWHRTAPENKWVTMPDWGDMPARTRQHLTMSKEPDAPLFLHRSTEGFAVQMVAKSTIESGDILWNTYGVNGICREERLIIFGFEESRLEPCSEEHFARTTERALHKL